MERYDGFFTSKDAAVQHGLKLCKDWIDKLRFGGKEKPVTVASLVTALEVK